MKSVNYTPRACEVLEEVQDLMHRKNMDYTSDIVGDDAYFPPGWEIAPNAVLLNTKLQRYVASVAGGEDNTPEECLRDMIAYAARAVAHLESQDPLRGITYGNSANTAKERRDALLEAAMSDEPKLCQCDDTVPFDPEMEAWTAAQDAKKRIEDNER